MTEPTITQADRERAASIAVLQEMRDLILAGRADHHAEPFARWREADIAEGVALGIEAAACHIDGQPDNGISYQTLWRVAGEVRHIPPAAIIAQHKRTKEEAE